LKPSETDQGGPARDSNSAWLSRTIVLLGCFLFLSGALLLGILVLARTQTDRILFEANSAYSQIRVRENAEQIRTLVFVDADGRERAQSSIDVNAPHELRLPYTRALFSTLLLREKHERILIVGLGGGGMVRFANHALPDAQVDAIEIDPVVVEVAQRFFGTAPGPRTSIFTEDAFDFLARPHEPYDVIYMDAFLRPTEDSELEEIPARLRTSAFLHQLSGHLEPGGLIAFNFVLSDPTTSEDLAAVQDSFPVVYELPVPGGGNLIAIGCSSPVRWTRAELETRARKMADSGIELPFLNMADSIMQAVP